MSDENVVTNKAEAEQPTEQKSEPVSGTPEYDEQMAAKGTAAQNVYQQNVPDKFKREDGSVDLEGLAKSYVELEKQFHSKPTEETQVPVEEQEIKEKQEFRIPTIEEPKEGEPEELTPLTQEDYREWGKELAKTGTVSEETRLTIKAKTNLTDEMINDWALAQQARNKENFQTAANMVGSQEKLSSVLNWASKNLSSEQQAIINERLGGPDYEITLHGMVSMYDKAMANAPKAQEPVPPPNRAPNPAGRSIIEGFTSYGEFTEARSDPRFMQDANFRGAVEERMVKTNWQSLPR